MLITLKVRHNQFAVFSATITLVLLLTVSTITAQPNKAGQADAIFKQGIELASADSAESMQASLPKFEQACRLFRELNEKPKEASCLSWAANVYGALGEKQKALEYFAQALLLYRAVGNKSRAAITLNHIGVVYSDLGENRTALDYYNQALQFFRTVGDQSHEAITVNNIGTVYSGLGERQKALDYYNQALRLFRAAGNQEDQASTLSNIGEIYFYLGEQQKALQYSNQALLTYRAFGDKSGEASALNRIGGIYQSLGEQQKALQYFNQALPLARAIGDKLTEATTLNSIGWVYAALGEQQKALAYYAQSLPLARAVGDKAGEAVVLNNLSAVWNDLHNPRLAAAYGKLAVNNYGQLRGNVAGLDKNLQQTFLKSIEESYRRLADLLIASNRLAEAQQVLNLFKDQQFFDFDSNKQIAALAFTARETEFAAFLKRKLETINALSGKVDELKRAGAGNAVLNQLEANLQTATNDYLTFLQTAATDFAAALTAKDKQPPSADLTNLQTALRELTKQTGDPAVAVYTLVSKKNYRALLITGDGIVAVSAAINDDELNKKALELWNLLRTPEYDPQATAKELYDIVFKQLAAKLPKETRTILWSLDGNLRYVPMNALHDGQNYLVTRYQNVIFTRADKERLTRQTSPIWTATGMGSSQEYLVKLPEGDLRAPALPFVKSELAKILKTNAQPKGIFGGEMLLDARFSKTAMLGALKQQRPLVHIASHFRFVPGDEARSFLLLGDGDILTLDEMKRHNNLFQGVELLALSACQTAAQRADSNGREVDGFAELAQRLGAGAVLASLWEVSDASTSDLMTAFYRYYSAKGVSATKMSKAEALRRSQIALLTGEYNQATPRAAEQREIVHEQNAGAISISGERLRRFKENPAAKFGHPYYWSPFILIGNWR